jgi:hypothetical protein
MWGLLHFDETQSRAKNKLPACMVDKPSNGVTEKPVSEFSLSIV